MSELFCGVLGAFLGFLASALLLRFHYKQLFAQTVSQNRMDWINHFREEFGTVIGYAEMKGTKNLAEKVRKHRCEELRDSSVLEAEKARAKLLTRLNLNTGKLGNEYNAVFEERLKKIDFSKGATRKEIDELIDISRKILEFEWNRVKEEAKGEYQNV